MPRPLLVYVVGIIGLSTRTNNRGRYVAPGYLIAYCSASALRSTLASSRPLFDRRYVWALAPFSPSSRNPLAARRSTVGPKGAKPSSARSRHHKRAPARYLDHRIDSKSPQGHRPSCHTSRDRDQSLKGVVAHGHALERDPLSQC